MSLCEHGYTALWDCPYCLRECLECKRLVAECDLNGEGLCAECAVEDEEENP